MEDWDPQKMLDLYIYDYMLRKNMHTSAELFAKETNLHPTPVAVNPLEGFLSEWWSLFWDLYCSRLSKHQPTTEPFSSKVTQNVGDEPKNVHPVFPVPDMNYLLLNTYPAMKKLGVPNLLQTVIPTMPWPNMGNFQANALSTMMPRFGSAPILDINMLPERNMTNLMAARMSEQDSLSPPAWNLYSNSHIVNVDKFAHMPLSSSGSRHARMRVNNKRQLSLTTDDNISTGLRNSAAPSITALRKIQPNAEAADIGRKKIHKISSGQYSLTGVGHADNTPVPNQQKQFSASSAHFQQDSTPDMTAQPSKKVIISAPGCSTKMGSPILVKDGSKKEDFRIGKTTEMEKPLDEDIESFFSNDEAQEVTSASFWCTSPQSSPDQKKVKQQGFPFQQLRSLHPTDGKLSCCDFSTPEKFLAAAGHEKKVYIWNLNQSTCAAVEGHSLLITDLRFKPNSYAFATSSFDRTVKIWDASNPRKSPVNLVGHAEHVTSVDFHPRQADVLCSCDTNDEIRLWNLNESANFHSFKGANRQVRFQPQKGILLAAATGNVVNLIDVETGIFVYRFEGHSKDVRSICWDFSGKYIVSASEDSARIWSILSGGKCVHELHSVGNKFESCTFHPGYAQVVAVGSYQSIDIWNPIVGGNRTWTFRAHEGIVSGLAHAPGTNMIASVSHDQWVKLWK